jgi:hypothetical protein
VEKAGDGNQHATSAGMIMSCCSNGGNHEMYWLCSPRGKRVRSRTGEERRVSSSIVWAMIENIAFRNGAGSSRCAPQSAIF